MRAMDRCHMDTLILIETAIIESVFIIQDGGAILGSSSLESFCRTQRGKTVKRSACGPQTYLYNNPS